MADEEKNDNTEEKDQAEKAPEAAPAEEAASKEPTADASPPDTPAGEAEEMAVDEAPEAEDAPAEDEAADKEPTADATPPDTPAGAAEEVAVDGDEDMNWKAKARLERSKLPHEAGPQRDPAERDAERVARRKAAIGERSRYRKRSRSKSTEKGTPTPPAEREAVDRKIRQGTVVSNKADKTITVRIDVARRHPTYEKIVRQSGTLHAHDERNEASEGDLVQVVETRPLSKLKRWRLTEILEKAK